MNLHRPATTAFRACRKLVPRQQKRYLSLHEYQSQNLLKEYGIPVAQGRVAETPGEVGNAVKEIGKPCVIKSQILRGGRGKGTFDSGLQGGIQKVDSAKAAESMASQMLGHRLKTKQTTGPGLKVDKLYVVESIQYDEEWYLAMTIDRESYRPAIILSKSGGVDIETMAKNEPEKLLTFHFSITEGITPSLMDSISSALETNSQAEKSNLQHILTNLHRLFVSKDATLLEINPLVKSSSSSSTLTCLDAKFTFDNAASRRQADLFSLNNNNSSSSKAEESEESTSEAEAAKHGLVYVRMEGNVGNVVNGAGLAMATNDAIAFHGGRSANFLDAGGQATKETMIKAFDIILGDPRVEVILVNIYGGIIRCDMIAESIIGAARELGPLRVPIVARLQGTNSEEGLKLLEEANLGIHVEAEFGEAAKRAVELASGK